jgi:hypothetical protein
VLSGPGNVAPFRLIPTDQQFVDVVQLILSSALVAGEAIAVHVLPSHRSVSPPWLLFASCA